jgi:hypothetical protein
LAGKVCQQGAFSSVTATAAAGNGEGELKKTIPPLGSSPGFPSSLNREKHINFSNFISAVL